MTKTNPEMIAVVMAGGRGTRFWPRSRGRRPKQFLAMVGKETLLHQTVNRLKPLFPERNIYIVTTAHLAAETRHMLPVLPDRRLLGVCLLLMFDIPRAHVHPSPSSASHSSH